MHSEGLKWRALEGHCAKVPQAVDAGLEALGTLEKALEALE